MKVNENDNTFIVLHFADSVPPTYENKFFQLTQNYSSPKYASL